MFDRDRNGYICEQELKQAMLELGVVLTDEDVRLMLKEADLDGDGRINYQGRTHFVTIFSISNRIPTVVSDCTIVTSGHHGSIRTTFISNNSTIWQNNSITQKTCNRKYTWLHILLLPTSGYSIWDTENYFQN